MFHCGKLQLNFDFHLLSGYRVAFRKGKFPAQTLLYAWWGLWAQPRYEAPADLSAAKGSSTIFASSIKRI